MLMGLFFFMAVFGITLGAVLWLYVPEVVEPKVVPFATALNWIAASIVIILFPILTDHAFGGDPGYLFIFFAAVCCFNWLFNIKYLVETKDKTHKAIQ